MHSEGMSLRTLKLVVCDDHDRARDALVRRLASDERIRVVGATGACDEALRLVRDHAPHALLVDTRRDDGQSLAAISRIVAEPEDVRPLVVVYNAFFDAEAWGAARVAGASDWLLKSIDVDGLFEKVSRAVIRELPRRRWDA